MKNHRFLWLRNRTTNNRKCEKARNIKEKRTIEMFNTVSKLLVEHHSSPNDNLPFRERQFQELIIPEVCYTSGISLYSYLPVSGY